MASNLYEVLGLDRTATSEDIRKAYRKRALKTHPDRLPQGVSETERQAANEQFRLVNNAYEVLTDPTNRKLYDTHGVWPPPSVPSSSPSSSSPYSQSQYNTQTQTQAGPSGSYNRDRGTFPFPFPGPSPFDTSPFFTGGRPSPFQFHFTDPFELFNSLFGDTRRPGFSWGPADLDDPFDDHPFFSDSRGEMGSPFGFGGGPFGFGPFGGGGMFGGGPFGGGGGPPGGGPRDPFGRPLMGQFGPFAGHPLLQFGPSNANASVRSYSSSTMAMGGGQGGREGQWVSQSTMTRSVNGRSETIVKRRDAQGNEHVTYTSPEGERYTINGVEQPTASGRGLPSSSSSFPSSSATQQSQGLPQASNGQPQIQSTAFAPPPPQMQGAAEFPPPFASQQPQQVGRSQSASRHSSSSSGFNVPVYDQPDAQRDRPSTTHHTHRSSHDRPRDSSTRPHSSHSHSHSHSQNYDSPISSARRNRDKIYAPPGDRDSGHHVGDRDRDRDSGHHVGDSGSRHREDYHGRSGGSGGSGRHGSVGW